MKPFNALQIVHNSVRRELVELLELIPQVEVGDRHKAEQLTSRFAAFEDWLKDHEYAEESIFFPAIEERAAYVVRAYELDHRSNDDISEAVKRDLDALLKLASVSELQAAKEQLYRDFLALDSTMKLHLRKEEQHLVPLSEELLTLSEQGSIVGRMPAASGPERIPAGLGWMFPRLSTDDRQGLLAIMSAGAPPQVFEGLVRIVAGVIPTDDWQALVQRMPQLAGAIAVPV